MSSSYLRINQIWIKKINRMGVAFFKVRQFITVTTTVAKHTFIAILERFKINVFLPFIPNAFLE